jgi:hypothetical protein
MLSDNLGANLDNLRRVRDPRNRGNISASFVLTVAAAGGGPRPGFGTERFELVTFEVTDRHAAPARRRGSLWRIPASSPSACC